MFRDRKDAAEQLAKALEKYRNESVLVIGIPKGGVEIAHYVAGHLNGELVVVVARKLGFPQNPETAFGAIAEDGSLYISTAAYKHLTGDEIHEVLGREKREITDRVKIFRDGKELPSMAGKTVIITDDGIATGATIFVTIDLCRRAHAEKIIVAAPVASERMEKILAQKADEVLILEKPEYFSAVSEGYEYFPNVTETEALELIHSHSISG